MKLNEIIKLHESGAEIGVTDNDYDIEVYFYNNFNDPMDDWDEAIAELGNILEVSAICPSGNISVNLADIIEQKLEQLEDAGLFVECEIDEIMDDISSILSGNVSVRWLQKFVDVLNK